MSLTTPGVVINSPAIDNLIQSSPELEWNPCWQITCIEPTQIDNVYCAIHKQPYICTITLVLLGSDEICTPTFVSEFARIYSLPTHKYKNVDSQFRRYEKLLTYRNSL